MSTLIPEPNGDGWLIGDATNKALSAHQGPPVLISVHDVKLCAGRPCVVHAPSDHHMRDWPLTWRASRGLMERRCLHGVGHPDPDDLAWHVANGRTWQGVHGCCGCCTPPQPERD